MLCVQRRSEKRVEFGVGDVSVFLQTAWNGTPGRVVRIAVVVESDCLIAPTVPVVAVMAAHVGCGGGDCDKHNHT